MTPLFSPHAKICYASWTALPLKMGLIRCPETSVTTNIGCLTSQTSEDEDYIWMSQGTYLLRLRRGIRWLAWWSGNMQQIMHFGVVKYNSVRGAQISGDSQQLHDLCSLPSIIRVVKSRRRTRWHSWLRHCATSRKVADSILDSIIGVFNWHNPSGRTMALGSTLPLTEMSTRNISFG
jgi:hypothetical protein